MFGIFNGMIRASTRSENWDSPDHWAKPRHLSTYERQRIEAAKHRAEILRETGLR